MTSSQHAMLALQALPIIQRATCCNSPIKRAILIPNGLQVHFVHLTRAKQMLTALVCRTYDFGIIAHLVSLPLVNVKPFYQLSRF